MKHLYYRDINISSIGIMYEMARKLTFWNLSNQSVLRQITSFKQVAKRVPINPDTPALEKIYSRIRSRTIFLYFYT